MGQSRSETVCWTCRARRKRCDGERPNCGTCQRLGLRCAGFNSASTPEWMDGGIRQREYTKSLRGCIKQRRRKDSSQSHSHSFQISTKSLPTPESPSPAISHASLVEFDFSSTDCTSPTIDTEVVSNSSRNLGSCSMISDDLSSSLQSSTEAFPLVDWLIEGSWSLTPQPASDDIDIWPASNPSECHEETHNITLLADETTAGLENPFSQVKAPDWSAVAHYLNHVWHWIFPFMCRYSEEALKARLLNLLGQSSMTYHTIMATANYSSLTSDNRETQSRNETSHIREGDWRYHYDLAISKYQDISRGSYKLTKAGMEEATVCLANFIVLRHVMGATIECSQKYLRILERAWLELTNGLEPINYQAAVSQMSPQDDCSLVQPFLAWIIQWAILREDFSSLPALHDVWLGYRNLESSHLFVKTIVCSQSVLGSIFEINRLACWKRLEVKEERLSARELGQRAHDIEKKLLSPGVSCESKDSISVRVRICYNSFHMRGAGSDRRPAQCDYHVNMATKTTALFQQAALIYMHTVLSGTRPRVREIRTSVSHAVKILKACADAQLVEYVAWPVFIVGCMIGYETDEEKQARDWLNSTLESLTRHGRNTMKQVEIWSAIRKSWRVLDVTGASEYDLLEMMENLGVDVPQII
ncbi:fungal-specific transcription factor domain-containing protein [Xylaria venustula]|nr:fungal-specific transcription factor domain-containing protein [Xylaria venustula]